MGRADRVFAPARCHSLRADAASSPAVMQGAQVVLLAGTLHSTCRILSTLVVILTAGLTRSRTLRVLLIVAATLGLVRMALPRGATPTLDVVFLLYTVVALVAMAALVGRR